MEALTFMEALMWAGFVVLALTGLTGVALCVEAKRGDRQRERENLHARLVAIHRHRRDWYLD